MACAVAALGASGAVTINAADAVRKSYPGFWQDLQKLNATVSLTDKS
jgi:3-phosphoshikimate 1-carboxyvinyltransferase